MRLLRGRIVDFPDDTPATPDAAAEVGAHLRDLPDGILRIEDGRITGRASFEEARAVGWPVEVAEDHRGRLITPGFIDAHVHCPQLDVMGAWGEQLIRWLERHTFPAESRFADPATASAGAARFLDALLAHGTTSALIYATSHAGATDALFEAAAARRMRIAAGKVLMDRNAPAELRDTAASGEADSRALIERWHGVDRLTYAVTPRFAPTSTPAQLDAAGRLVAEHEGVLMQTHLSENTGEIAWVKELFPEARDYTDVYDRHGLLGPRSLLGHGIHLSDAELAMLAERGARVVFCPSSNLFLGSGLLDLARLDAAGVGTAIGSDVGGGTSLSMLSTAADAYKVLQLLDQVLDPARALYLVTLGNARALHMAEHVGNFETGREADVVILDSAAPAVLAHRSGFCDSVTDLLFAFMVLGDDRSVHETIVLGETAHAATSARDP